MSAMTIVLVHSVTIRRTDLVPAPKVEGWRDWPEQTDLRVDLEPPDGIVLLLAILPLSPRIPRKATCWIASGR
ncbi:hypothetical protein [Pendulispora albinea]|uniref:Uncharacterized protein n=1 Tax=Pendulispora albinea TaxID=2741071 RepID=A0ABZ2LN14_9BACT